MDKTLDLKSREFKKALYHLEEILKEEPDEKDFVRDATIQRFEYCFEICFKIVKTWLRYKFGVEELSPKSCFRALIKTNLFTGNEVETLLLSVDDRNKIVHTYNDEFVKKLYKNIKNYLTVFKKIYIVIDKNMVL